MGTLTPRMFQKIFAQEDAIARLRAMLPPGTRVKTIVRHVARSGMSRSISVIYRDEDISWLVAPAIGGKFDRKHGGIRITGCGMDMGYAVVYSLSSALYPGGFGCIGESCPANDHHNGDRSYEPHTDAARWHAEGGYALRQEWL